MRTAVLKTFRWRTWGVLLLPALLLVLATLRPLALPDEGRYAEVGRWMWLSGDWLTPRLNGIPFFHKPPLLYWLEAATLSVFGATPWAARGVVAAHACLMWAVMVLSVRHIAGGDVARRAAWMLASSLAFLIGGQYINHDMVVATWISVAIWCFARAFMQTEGVHAGWACAGFVACALGVLSKGLIGLLLPGLVLFVWIAWTRQWRKILHLPWTVGMLLFIAIAVPWFVLAEMEHPGMLAYMFGKHQFGRYTATTFNNARPWWFYGVAVALLMFPWVFLVLFEGVQSVWRRLVGLLQASAPVPDGRVDAAWVALCWIWVIAILGFFSIPHSKLVGYALPVMPPLALLAALWWERRMAPLAWSRRVFISLVSLAVITACAANWVATGYTWQRSSADVAQVLRCALRSGDGVAAVEDYPYDLPFYAQLARPMDVVQDWESLRATAGDNWRRELLEGSDFDAQAAQSLAPLTRLSALKTDPHAWLVAPRDTLLMKSPAGAGFELFYEGRAWSLYRSTAASATKAALKTCVEKPKTD
jgi:4-amino-4-deoxy-L-arabinose transferase-like glycosyltransferase